MIDFINPTRFSLCLNSVTGSKFQVPGGLGTGDWVRCSRRSEFGDRTPDSRVESPEVQSPSTPSKNETNQIKINQNEIKIKVKDSRQTDRQTDRK